MEEIKNVKVSRRTQNGDIFVTQGTALNYDKDENKSVRIFLENSVMEDVTISVRSGAETIYENPGTALGATAVAVGKSILGVLTKNPYARRMENPMMKDLGNEYTRIMEKNTPHARVLWEKKFSDLQTMRLETDGTVELHEKDGTVFVLTFKGYRKAKKWFEEAKMISGMKSVDN